MPTLTLKRHHSVRVEIEAFEKNPYVDYEVESEQLVKTYILDEDGLEDYRNNKTFNSYNNKIKGRYNSERIRVPYKGYYYLVIYNPNDNDVAIHYELY